MTTITKNTLVTLTLKIESEKGDLLDNSDKLMYLHGGYEQIFVRLEHELESKKVHDTFNILLTPADAFGEYNTDLVVQEALENLPDDIEVGMELDGEEEGIIWIVEQIEEDHAVLNANHELAGVPLRVSGEIIEIEALGDEAVEEILNMDHEH
ncbi:MAG TPA: peptidylprolyl isomerase [Helicobacteraceae bacterium]|nr:peptidylprolyl isomerase [Helicobacteraceae bacterium]